MKEALPKEAPLLIDRLKMNPRLDLETTLPAHAEAGETPPKVFQTGSLRYTWQTLSILFVWLLWGDFAFTFFENIFGRFIPLYLKDLHSSNSLIGIMTGSIAGAVNVCFMPNISQWSDRTRSRWGRRIPFLYVATPLTVVSLIAVGFAPEIAGWIHRGLLIHLAPAVSETGFILTLLCAVIVSYHFFNMVLVNAYTWLQRDVVPQEVMGRFLSWIRIVSTLGNFLFLWYVFPHLKAHREGVFLGIGLFYLIAFLLMCLNVKEGEYPPPPSKEETPGMLKSFLLYFRECLCLPIYRNFFIAWVLVIGATSCAQPFSILFAREGLGLDMDSMGKIFAWGSAVSALVYLPMGWICDRLTPLRLALGSLGALMAFSLLACLSIHSRQGFLIYTLAWTLPMVAWSLGASAATMTLFPPAKFGQFSAGLNVFGCGGIILGNYLMGKLIDLVHSDYRITFVWSTVLFALAIYPFSLVYRDWQRHGRPHRYVPPPIP